MMARGTARPRSWWIPWSFLGFFVVVFVANGIMVFFAFDSWTGVTTENAYEKGLAYNEQLAEARAQEKRGWQAGFAFAPTGSLRGSVELDLKDSFGTPIRGAAVGIALVRPTHAGHDVTFELRDLGDGRYGGEIELPLAGQWDIHLLADHERGSYRLHRRILVK